MTGPARQVGFTSRLSRPEAAAACKELLFLVLQHEREVSEYALRFVRELNAAFVRFPEVEQPTDERQPRPASRPS